VSQLTDSHAIFVERSNSNSLGGRRRPWRYCQASD